VLTRKTPKEALEVHRETNENLLTVNFLKLMRVQVTTRVPDESTIDSDAQKVLTTRFPLSDHAKNGHNRRESHPSLFFESIGESSAYCRNVETAETLCVIDWETFCGILIMDTELSYMAHKRYYVLSELGSP
jgi:hypothetical protein